MTGELAAPRTAAEGSARRVLGAEPTPAPRGDSFSRRFVFKLGGNLVGLPLGAATQAVIARGLGAAAYGNLNFLTAVLSSAFNFVDSGSSTCLYTKLCRAPDDDTPLTFYWRFALGVLVVVMLALIGCLGLGLLRVVLPGQRFMDAVLAALAAYAVWAVAVAGRVVDAQALSVPGELARILQRLVSLVLFGALLGLAALRLPTVFAAQTAVSVLLLVLWGAVLRRSGRTLVPLRSGRPGAMRVQAREFWEYSHPLLLTSGLVTGGTVLERWLLQFFGGSPEQGLFSLSAQIGALCFAFTGAVVPLLAREMAQAFERRDAASMRTALTELMPRAFWVAAVIGLFLAGQADYVTRLVGGAGYERAAVPVILMCLYPIHQTYGQLTASVFFATGDTRTYRNIGFFDVTFGLLLAVLFLAPRPFGMALGAVGLALRLVLGQFAGVNLQLWLHCRRFDVRYRSVGLYQLRVIVALGLLSAIVRTCASGAGLRGLTELAVAALTYAVGLAAMIAVRPALIGLTNSDVLLLQALARRLGLTGRERRAA